MSLASVVGGAVARTVPTAVGLLIDKSGSMYEHTQVVNDALQYLVTEQKKIKDVTKPSFLLAEFNHEYNKVLDKNFQDIDPKNFYKYRPDGGTCITQSIFDITRDMENKLQKTEGKVKRIIIGILTDGQNGCSSKTDDDVKELIKRKEKEGWEYMFFGAEGNSLEVAENMGISKDRAAIFGGNVEGSLKLINDKITQVRKGKPLMITATDRETLALPTHAHRDL